MRPFTKTALAAPVLLAAALAAPSAASAHAGTPPHLVVDATPSFVVGQQIGLSAQSTADEPMFPDWTPVELSQHWHATASGGIARYVSLQQYYDGSQGAGTNGPSTHVEYGNNDYNSEYGGGGYNHYWVVRAFANDGGVTKVTQGQWHMYVVQEDGRHPSMFGAPHAVTYGGTWGTASCECFSGGGWAPPFPSVYHVPQTRFTSQRGASVTYQQNFGSGDHVGIVMPMSANRGAASIRVDGKAVATVNTNSSTTRNRVVVWQKSLPAGVHRITVVNLATPGHPRIDIDAFLHNG
jgi:hypothetical protein